MLNFNKCVFVVKFRTSLKNETKTTNIMFSVLLKTIIKKPVSY